MLILERMYGEKIRIGDNIVITVVDIDRGKIRLGIEAPREVPIFRKELLSNDAKREKVLKSKPPPKEPLKPVCLQPISERKSDDT